MHKQASASYSFLMVCVGCLGMGMAMCTITGFSMHTGWISAGSSGINQEKHTLKTETIVVTAISTERFQY
jgi:hypothetical protein